MKKILIIHITSALEGSDTGDQHIRRQVDYSRKVSHILLRDRYPWNPQLFMLLPKVARDIISKCNIDRQIQ